MPQKMSLQVSSYKKLVFAMSIRIGADEKLLSNAIESFEPIFFNNTVLVLDSYFTHGSRTIEPKDATH